MEPPEGEWLTLADAARTLGVQRDALRMAARRGRLAVHRRTGQGALVSGQEVERYRREHLGKYGHVPIADPSPHTLQQRRYRERKRAHAQAQQSAGSSAQEGT